MRWVRRPLAALSTGVGLLIPEAQVPGRAASAVACLTWDRPFASVHWRPPLSVAMTECSVT